MTKAAQDRGGQVHKKQQSDTQSKHQRVYQFVRFFAITMFFPKHPKAKHRTPTGPVPVSLAAGWQLVSTINSCLNCKPLKVNAGWVLDFERRAVAMQA